MPESTERATRESWKILPLPEKRVEIPFERTFTADEYQELARGVIPQEMEDKWFIFCENDVLYFHRSWTGYCILQVPLVFTGTHWEAR